MPQRSAAGVARAQAELRANPSGPGGAGRAGDGGGGMGRSMAGMAINRGVDTAEVIMGGGERGIGLCVWWMID